MKNNIQHSEKSVDENPFRQFGEWYHEHLESGVANPEAMALGTASSDGRISVRMVLLKYYDESGFVFFTNYNSKKGNQISTNAFASLLFYWPESGRQVRIEGRVTRTSGKESDAYFASRPRESQIGACASEQSKIIPDRHYLENRYAHFESLFRNRLVERPADWGGYRIVPDHFEFWQEGEFRLHDRVVYTRSGESWLINRLAP